MVTNRLKWSAEYRRPIHCFPFCNCLVIFYLPNKGRLLLKRCCQDWQKHGVPAHLVSYSFTRSAQACVIKQTTKLAQPKTMRPSHCIHCLNVLQDNETGAPATLDCPEGTVEVRPACLPHEGSFLPSPSLFLSVPCVTSTRVQAPLLPLFFPREAPVSAQLPLASVTERSKINTCT